MSAGRYDNILIIKPSSLGDLVLALPALTALRSSFPNACISWLVKPQFAPLLQGHPHLDHILIFDRRLLGKAYYHPRALVALIRLFRRLASSRFDVVFDFQGLFRTAALALCTRSPVRFGMADARELAPLFYTHKIPLDPARMHLVDRYLEMVRLAGACCDQPRFVLPVSEAALASVQQLLSANRLADVPYAVLAIGSAHPDKRWPIERFVALARYLRDEFDLPAVAVGAASEAALLESASEDTNSPLIVNLAGSTSLQQLVALLSRAALVVSNDTGPGHIAAALGRPVVMIFGRSNPARVFPYGRPHCVAAVEPFSRPICIDSPDPRHAVTNVMLEDVLDKVRRQLAPEP